MYSVKKNKTKHRSFISYSILLFLCVAVSLSAGCRSRPNIPVRDGYFFDNTNLRQYKVRTGDTLYSIAWHLNRDYKEVAAINGIVAPYAIYPGQVLQLTGNQQNFPSARDPRNNHSGSAGPVISDQSENQGKTNTSTRQVELGKSIEWTWPTDGKLISRFSSKGIGHKGLDIHGEQGDPVRSAANGFVVYRGDALLGYGKIIIIKHNDEFLSAYAHNSRILVREGQWVKHGQQIAKIGSSGTDRNKLHFEIRREGIPVDPLRYLPIRN